jgi:hypothetical protein
VCRLVVPLLGKTLQATGEIVLRAELHLWVKTNAPAGEQIIFRVDSATEMTTMRAAEAALLDLPLPAKPVPGLRHTQTGLEIQAGFHSRSGYGYGRHRICFSVLFPRRFQ